MEAPVVKKRIEFHHDVSSSVIAGSIKDQVVAHANTPQRGNLKSNPPRNPWCEEIIRSGGTRKSCAELSATLTKHTKKPDSMVASCCVRFQFTFGCLTRDRSSRKTEKSEKHGKANHYPNETI